MKRIALILLLCAGLTACYPIDVPGSGGSSIPVTGTVTATTTLTGVTIEDARLSTMSKDYFVGVAEGDISGHNAINKLGYNAAVGTSEEDVWFGSSVYTFPAAAQQMELVSTSVEDDPLKADLSVGTGIHTVIIYYLDNTYTARTEQVQLNGTGVVTTAANNILRVNDIRAWVCGTGYKAAGTISIRNLADTPVYRYIGTGYTRSRCSIYTVPLTKTLYIMNWFVGVGGLNAANNARVTLKATYNELGSNYTTGTVLGAGFFMPMAEVLLPNGNVQREFTIPIMIPATCDVKVSAYSDAGSSFVGTSYRGWIE